MRGRDRTESATLHPIQVVARRTGLTPDVLRAWEKRYRAVSPARSEGGRRLYSDDDVRRLLLLHRATIAGRSIGRIASLSTDAIDRLVAEDEAAVAAAPVADPLARDTVPVFTADASSYVELAHGQIRALDASGLEATLARASVDLPRIALLERVLVPLMHQVGDRWRAGDLSVAHEHLATAVVRTFLGALGRTESAAAQAPALVVTTPPGHLHELGALHVAAAAAADGWRIVYLGPNLPVEDVAAAAKATDARAVALSLTYPSDDPHLGAQLARLRSLLPPAVTVLAGGSAAAAYAPALGRIGATIPADVSALREELARLRRPRREGARR